jgi:transposase
MFNEAFDNDYERASDALCEIQELYEIERISKEANLNFEAFKDVRSLNAAPILKGMRSWMQQQYVQVLPKSAIGKALAYSMEGWHKLSLYITDGRLKIDNNPVENSIRPVALGRKNCLFAGSHEAAKKSGMLYSLLGTCKMHGINPTAG